MNFQLLFEDQLEPDTFQPDLIVDAQNIDIDLITCTICRRVFNQPVSCDACQNHYCAECINSWLRTQNDCSNCPTCQNYKESRAYPILINMLSKLTFQCQNFKKGCVSVHSYDNVTKHLLSECQFQMNQCPSDGCQQQLLKSQLPAHLEIQCLYVQTQCEMCNQPMKKYQRVDHLQVCQEVIVNCEKCHQQLRRREVEEHAQYKCEEGEQMCNCGQKIIRKNTLEHEKVCSIHTVECPGCHARYHQVFFEDHKKTCEKYPRLCQICESSYSQNQQHPMDECLGNFQSQIERQFLQLKHQNVTLKKQLFQIKQARSSKKFGVANSNDQALRFNSTTIDQDIGISVDGDTAIVRKAKNRRRDRYVLVETQESLKTKPFEFKCQFTCINSNLVAIGICDESVIYKTVDATGPNNNMYLISADGTMYSHHSSEDNNQKKDFSIKIDDLLMLKYLPSAKIVIIRNETIEKEVEIEFDSEYVFNKQFFPCICLRTSYDQIKLIQETKLFTLPVSSEGVEESQNSFDDDEGENFFWNQLEMSSPRKKPNLIMTNQTAPQPININNQSQFDSTNFQFIRSPPPRHTSDDIE